MKAARVSLDVPRLRWTLCEVLRRIGYARIFVLVTLFTDVVVYGVVLVPLQDEIRSANQQLMQTKTLSSTASIVPDSGTLQQFYASFPDSAKLTEIQGQLFELAARHRLRLTQGEYRLANEISGVPKGVLASYEIDYPLSGDYRDIREFVAEALRDQPTLALSGMTYSRDNSQAQSLNAEAHFLLYVRGER